MNRPRAFYFDSSRIEQTQRFFGIGGDFEEPCDCAPRIALDARNAICPCSS